MNKKVRSARGEMVDFDLLKIKSQIATPTTPIVQEREKTIDRKLKRKIKKVEAPIPKSKTMDVSVSDEKPVKKQKARNIEHIEDKTNELETDQQ